ncbi:hypothetical protein B0O80DRAFT_18288 [Mortierella sp. GBAus27b]|nr:hypothetical protein B0O80DRAFT_18288 [Mortierella sp. GBAus27b]
MFDGMGFKLAVAFADGLMLIVCQSVLDSASPRFVYLNLAKGPGKLDQARGSVKVSDPGDSNTRSTMSCSAAQLPTPAELPAGSDTRRPRRQRASGRGGLIRDNIENALSTPSSQIPVTHINEEQSKRKRQSPSDCASKRRKVLQDTPPLTPQSSTLNITPLHRTLSEKSAYLNRASLSDVNPGRKESPSKISSTLACNGLSQSKRSGCESEDADDEDEPSVLNAVRSTSKTPTPQPPNDVPIVQLPLSYPGFDGNSAASTAKISLATGIPFSSFEDDLFGSDTTLTSPEDDSEDEEQSKTSPTQPCDVTPPSPSSQVPSTQLAAAPVKRRGPGRPRKNPLPDATSSKPCRRRTRKSVSEAKEAPSGALPETLPFAVHTTGSIQLSTTASVVPERPIGGTRVSLMARIIDAKVSQRVLDDDDSELSDDAEVQLGKQTEAPLTASMAAQECQSDFVQANGSAPDSDHSLERTDQTSVVTSTSDHVSAPTSSKLALPSTEAKDHVFAVPTAAARRAVRSSARARSFTDRRYSHRRPVSRQNYTRPILRHMPRPRLHQTCLEIVSRSASAQEQPSIQRIASMLRCRLQKAVQCSRDDAMENTPSTNIMGQEQKSLQMQAWGAVIGNGKGLGNNWTRKQEDQQQRVVERRAIVADAYRALHFPPPPENWDKSSKVIDAGYSLKNEPDTSVASGTISERWTAVRDDALDHLSRRVGCEYCRKTFRNRNGLIAHTGRCTMARLVCKKGLFLRTCGYRGKTPVTEYAFVVL